MNDLIKLMFDNGVFERRYKYIIEIYPQRATNSQIFDAALKKLSETHDIYKIARGYMRAFEKGL